MKGKEKGIVLKQKLAITLLQVDQMVTSLAYADVYKEAKCFPGFETSKDRQHFLWRVGDVADWAVAPCNHSKPSRLLSHCASVFLIK